MSEDTRATARQGKRTPPAMVIGVILVTFVLAAGILGEFTVGMVVALVIGVILLATGLIQRSIEARR